MIYLTKKIILTIMVGIIIIICSPMVHARYYDPDIGRFTTADIETPGEGADSQGLNRYSYCFNNPLIYTDPTGNLPSVGDPNYKASKQETFPEVQVKPLSNFRVFLADNIRAFDPDQNQPPNDIFTAIKSTFYSVGRTQTNVTLLHHGAYDSGNKASIKRAILYFGGQMKWLDPIGLGQMSMFAADMYSIPSTFAGIKNAYRGARKLSINAFLLSKTATKVLRGFTVAELGLNTAGAINASLKLSKDLQEGADLPLIGRDVLGVGEFGVNVAAGVSMLYGIFNKSYFTTTGGSLVKFLTRYGAWMRTGAVGLKFLGRGGYIMQGMYMIQHADEYNIPDNLKESIRQIESVKEYKEFLKSRG